MSAWEGLILGIVQGLTEFLPISSDGHLAMARMVLGFGGPNLAFDVFVHGATLLVIVVYFRKRLVELAVRRSVVYVGKLVFATVPAVIAVLTVRELIDRALASPEVVVVCLALTGTALLSLYFVPRDRWTPGDDGTAGRAEPTWAGAWWMGCAQALAILPGLSRSGSTIVTGIWLGLAPAAAAEFAFLMGIPAIGGAIVLELGAMREAMNGDAAAAYAAGAVAAFVSGLAAIALVFRFLARREFRWFGFYCWGAAIAFAAFLWLR